MRIIGREEKKVELLNMKRNSVKVLASSELLYCDSLVSYNLFGKTPTVNYCDFSRSDEKVTCTHFIVLLGTLSLTLH